MFTYVILDNLPAVPEHFEKIVQDIVATEDVSPTRKVDLYDPKVISSQNMLPGYQARELIINGEKIRSTQSMRFSLGDEWNNWIIENINPEAANIAAGVAFTTGSRYHGAHCDGARNYVLMYVLDQGGPNVETVFYQEQGRPLFNPRTKAIDTYWVSDYSQLTEIERVCFPKKKWVLLNTRILHGVENIETTRIVYQVGFNKNIYFPDDNANLI